MFLPESIAEILGGEKVLGSPVSSQFELAEAVRHGFLPAVTDELFDGTILTKSDMERLVMPRRTLTHRIKKGERLTREESDRIARVARIVAMAEETFGNRDKASRWLHKPKRAFDSQTPIDLLDTEEGARIVEDRLFRIAHGLAA
ncbi:MAG: antitoxin Xre/MbcA/ParS toxin-binding domain-containing protein [Candidatus Thiodiazotropha endolucinida]